MVDGYALHRGDDGRVHYCPRHDPDMRWLCGAPQSRVFVWCKPPRCTTPVTTEFVLVGRRGNHMVERLRAEDADRPLSPFARSKSGKAIVKGES